MTAAYETPDEPSAGISPSAFRDAVGRFATGITVVTTRVEGVDHAMTANAFASVSLDPPLVLVCVEKAARFHGAVLDSGLWAVSVLAESARRASMWFAHRGRPLDNQFAGFPYVRGDRTGVPVFTDALASLECRTYAVYAGGDHSIVVGEVLSVAQLRPDGKPLLYYGGKYGILRGSG